MTTAQATDPGRPSDVGALIRHWRLQRRLTQLDLANASDVSTRHLSFVETGRSRPTSQMILHLSEHLDIPLRDRNVLLLAAGHAPRFAQHGLTDTPMAAISEAINHILQAHYPYPAVVIGGNWDLIAANEAIDALTAGASPWLLEPPVNVLRLSLHPEGMAPRIRNLGQWRAHLLSRLERQIDADGCPELQNLLDELNSYPGETEKSHDTSSLLVPLRIEANGEELSLFSTTTVFGTPQEITVSELAIESFYPADPRTTDLLRGRRPIPQGRQ